jgi:hypothetical protein
MAPIPSRDASRAARASGVERAQTGQSSGCLTRSGTTGVLVVDRNTARTNTARAEAEDTVETMFDRNERPSRDRIP